MPQIQPYDDEILAQGGIGVRATSEDFGAQIGAGLQRFGAGLQEVGEVLHKEAEARDVTSAHVALAKARAEWDKTVQDRANSATPGDPSFVEKLAGDLDGWMAQVGNQAKTAAGRRVYQTASASIRSEALQQAIRINGELSAKAAGNGFEEAKAALGSLVFNDHSRLDSTLEQARAIFDDPKGVFAKIPSPVRDKYRAELEREVRFAAVKGLVRRDPEAVLQSVAPEQLQQFAPWKTVIDANAAPGGKVDISPATMAKAPTFTAEAAVRGVNPNVPMAMADAGATEKPEALVDQVASLVDRYGGNYQKALAAFKLGPDMLDSILIAAGPAWQAAVPEEVQGYVETVLVKSGAVASSAPNASTPEPPAPVERVPVASSLPSMAGLTWEQQDNVVKEGVQLQHLRMTMAIHAREEQKQQQEQAQKQVMNGFLQQIVDPKKYGKLTESTILANDTLTWSQKQHMVDYSLARLRELKSAADTKTNPEEVRRLLLQLYANPDDPNKSYSVEPAMEAYRLGRISTGEMMLIRREVDGLRDGSTGSFQKSVQSARNVVHDVFSKSVEGTVRPGVAAEAWYRFSFDLDRQIAAKREKNEDPRPLLDPNSRDYLLKPERLQSFMAGAKAAIGDGAKAVVEQGAGQLPTWKEFDKLPIGASFTDKQGNVRVKTKE